MCSSMDPCTDQLDGRLAGGLRRTDLGHRTRGSGARTLEDDPPAMTVSVVFPSTPDVLRRWGAGARLHAARFHKPTLFSLLVLATPSQRFTSIPDAVATVTVVPTRTRVAIYAIAWVCVVAATPILILEALDAPVLAPLAVVAFIATVLVSAGLSRRMTARRYWSTKVGEWLLADVASARNGAGDELLGVIAARADSEGRQIVLRVKSDNIRAVSLYARHGFVDDSSSGEMIAMTRQHLPDAPGSLTQVETASTRRETVTTLVAVSAAVVGAAVYWGSPVVWLMPTIAVVGSAASLTDLRSRRVPNALTSAGLAVIVFTLLTVWAATGHFLMPSAAIGAGIFAGPLFIAHVVTREHVPGLGDVKLAGLLGAVAGAVNPSAAYISLLLSLLIGAVFGTIWRAHTNQKSFPFAPPLAAVTFGVLVAWAITGSGTNW